MNEILFFFDTLTVCWTTRRGVEFDFSTVEGRLCSDEDSEIAQNAFIKEHVPNVAIVQLGFLAKTLAMERKLSKLTSLLGPVVRSMVSANHWLRNIKTYTFLW